jgi:leucyl aminopeptidase
MDIRIVSPAEARREAAVACFQFEGDRAPAGPWRTVSPAIGESAARAAKEQGFDGKLRSFLLAVPGGAGRVLVTGLGRAKALGSEALRRAAADLPARCRSLGIRSLAVIPPFGAGIDAAVAVQALVEGLGLSAYTFTKYKRDDGSAKKGLATVGIVADAGARAPAQAGADRGRLLVRGVCFARDLVNEPASEKPPRVIASRAKALAGRGVSVKVLDEKACARLGMGAFLGVARGSDEPPRLIRLEYRPAKVRGTVCVIGKCITFDSGGLDIKPPDAMRWMKDDMSGAAAVLGLFSILRELRPSVRVVGLIAATENMPGCRAYKPGDVLRAMNGKTIEIDNTDAEGRLTLADMLAYASREKPDAVLDLATLTGACVIALGNTIAGLFTDDDALAREIAGCAARTGEKVWRMPLEKEYRDLNKSDIADIKNAGGRWGGAITAGLFLQEFIDPKIPWAHLDIAGPAFAEKARVYTPVGGTGVMVRTLAELLKGRSEGKAAAPARS